MVAQQPELYTVATGDNLTGIDATRVFAPVCLLDHRYYIDKYPNYYFIVRKDIYCSDANCQRVCLYKEGEVNKNLRGNEEPFTLLVSNELRMRRLIDTIYQDMEAKAAALTTPEKPKKQFYTF